MSATQEVESSTIFIPGAQHTEDMAERQLHDQDTRRYQGGKGNRRRIPKSAETVGETIRQGRARQEGVPSNVQGECVVWWLELIVIRSSVPPSTRTRTPRATAPSRRTLPRSCRIVSTSVARSVRRPRRYGSLYYWRQFKLI